MGIYDAAMAAKCKNARCHYPEKLVPHTFACRRSCFTCFGNLRKQCTTRQCPGIWPSGGIDRPGGNLVDLQRQGRILKNRHNAKAASCGITAARELVGD